MPDPQDHVVTASAEPAAIDWLEDGQMRSAPWLSLAGVAPPRRVVLADDTLTADAAQAMAARGPRPQLVELPGVGHAPMFMDAAQIAIVSDFLRVA